MFFVVAVKTHLFVKPVLIIISCVIDVIQQVLGIGEVHNPGEIMEFVVNFTHLGICIVHFS